MIDPKLIAEVPLFHSLVPEDRRSLAECFHEETIPAGTKLFDVGDAGFSMYIVGRGKVKIAVPAGKDGDKDVTLANLGPGEFFGELALLDGQTRSARATAALDTLLYRIDHDELTQFLLSNTKIALAMLAATARRLRHTDELMRSRATMDINAEVDRQTSFSEHLADLLAMYVGSWWFLIFAISLIAVWVCLNVLRLGGVEPFDNRPFELLSFVLGVLATLQAPVILMSQNREVERDRIQADANFKVNLKNEVALEKATEHLEDLKRTNAEMRAEARTQAQVLAKQQELLDRLATRAESEGNGGGAGARRPGAA